MTALCHSSTTIRYNIINYNLQERVREVRVMATGEELDDFSARGYLVRQGLLDPDRVSEFRTVVDELTSEELKNENSENYPGNALYIRYLLQRGSRFLQLARSDLLLGVARAMLGPQVQVFDMICRVSFLEEGPQQVMWHIHNRVVPQPLPPFFSYPHGMDALIYLDDVGAAEGPLCVLPGSHNGPSIDFPYGDFSDKEGQISIPVRSGDCIFCHSNLWHRALPSVSRSGRRRALIIGYMPAWFKTEFPQGRRPSGLEDLKDESLDPETQELLGSFQWT